MLEFIELCTSVFSSSAVPFILVFCGIFLSFKLRLFYFLHPLKTLRELLGSNKQNASHAAILALAGTLGVGNIAGVASAINLGGFGAVFWMWLSAIVAMSLKYAEIVLAMLYRNSADTNKPRGGAMYYIRGFFESLGLKRLGVTLSFVFAVCFLGCALTMGGMLQANAVSSALNGVMGIPKVITGSILAVLTLFIITKGSKRIVSVTNLLVPIMSIGYAVLSVAVILKNYDGIIPAFNLILSSAFSPRSIIGGVGGWSFISALRYGVMRGLISNEAGCGTAPSAHVISNCASAAKQGLWGIFEVFVDTVVLCTLTALAIILEYDAAMRFDGNFMMMTVAAFSSALGPFSEYFIAIAVLCFGFATIICWSHYGRTCMAYFSSKPLLSNVFCLAMGIFVFSGSFASDGIPWLLSDIFMGIMTVINLSVVTPMYKTVVQETSLIIKIKT